MEGGERRRARKPVDYAELADVVLDEDFDDFRNSPKSTTEKVKDRGEKVSGEEQKDNCESKHSKDRHRDHKRHKDRHREDRDRQGRDRDRHRKRDSKERDERRRREHKERRHRSDRKDDKDSQDLSRGEGSSDSTYDSSGTQTLHDSPATSIPVTTSPLVSPSRKNPKPRLSLDDKIFQRELQVVLELSKEDSSQNSPKTPEPEEHRVTDGGTTLDKEQENLPPLSPKSPQGHCAGGDCPPPTQKVEVAVEASPSTLQKPSEPECVEEEVVQKSDPPPPALTASMDTVEPMPSTSAGKTAKRIRKTVVFKEDSDSDDFDGFDYDVGAESEASEGSDFMPSPKKKKNSKDSKKTQNSKPTRNSTRKSSSKSTDQNRAGVVSSPRSHPVLAKENTAPKNFATPPPAKSTVTSPKVTTTPEPKVSSNLHTPPPAKATTKNTSVAKPVKRPLNNISSSTTLVKTSFKSPLSTPPNSVVSPATSVGTNTLYRGTRLRLGLSRRANLKPLHPSVAGRITN